MSINEEFDVKKYTDRELFAFMDLNNPSDRELEAKIYSLINLYNNANNKLSKKMGKFFEDVFTHFFYDVENEENLIEAFEDVAVPQKATVQVPLPQIPVPVPIPPQIPTPPVLRPVDRKYAVGILNPLLKESIKRIVCVDSQYRDLSLYPNPGDFTFNLSDTLTDIVSLKLYSIQIPFTWYTISSDYGSNFFIFKGNSPGIDKGIHDFKIEIESGNYQTSDFVTYLSKSFKTLFTQHPDVDFGTTSVLYNNLKSKLTFRVDIKLLYNETNYEVVFPTYSKMSTMITSIPELLGYTSTKYMPSAINSNNHINEPSQIKRFITSKNNTMIIKMYQSDYSIEGKILEHATDLSFSEIKVVLSLLGEHSAEEISLDINSQLKANPYLDSERSSFSFSENKFSMKINVNRKKVLNNQNIKSAVLFTEDPSYLPVYFGSNSLFQFDSSIIELNNIMSERNSLRTEYKISTSPYIVLSCKNRRYSTLDQEIKVKNSTYNLNTYIASINESFRTLKNDTNNSFDCSIDTQASILCKVNKEIPYNGNFVIDISNSFLHKVFNFNNVQINSSTTNKFTSLFTALESGVVVDSDNILIRSVGIHNSTVPITNAVFINTTTNFNLQNLQRDANNFFNTYSGPNNISLQGSSIHIMAISDNEFQCFLTINVTVVLKNVDFQLNFYEPDSYMGVADTWKSPSNSWYSNLGFMHPSYEIVDKVVSATILESNLITLDSSNNYFSIIPYYNPLGGVYTVDNENKILIKMTLPIGMSYTKEDIVSNINLVFSTNNITKGSYIDATKSKTKMRLNVNKVFSAQDYRLTFFDNSFKRGSHVKTTIENVKWDTTLGWVLGFRNLTEYELTKDNEVDYITQTSYSNYVNQDYSVDSSTNVVCISGDTSININLYNYVLIGLNDYSQNHLNDGLVTVTRTDYDIPLPSYANRSNYKCDASGQLAIFNTSLTAKQIYSANQILSTRQGNQKENVYASTPFTQDIFAYVPIKTAGLSAGQSFIDFSGSLQNQERNYFGPVNIKKISIQLLNDKGNILDLNNANWSFSFIAEQLYNPSRN